MARSLTYVEIAVAVALGGSLLAVAVPTFFKNLHASRLSEAVGGLRDISTSAVAYAARRPTIECFPPSAPLTPAQVPRGARVVDPPGTWDHLTWATLGFSISHAHYFSFAFDSALGDTSSRFVARAHGDLDGDGERSTFEIEGQCENGDARVLPGLYVDREVE